MAFEKFYDAGAGGYDRAFGHVSREFVPRLLAAARLAPGQRVLDIATGTGIAAEMAAEAVGPSGHVVAADISRPMLDRARERLGGLANISLAVEDGGRALSTAETIWGAVPEQNGSTAPAGRGALGRRLLGCGRLSVGW